MRSGRPTPVREVVLGAGLRRGLRPLRSPPVQRVTLCARPFGPSSSPYGGCGRFVHGPDAPLPGLCR